MRAEYYYLEGKAASIYEGLRTPLNVSQDLMDDSTDLKILKYVGAVFVSIVAIPLTAVAGIVNKISREPIRPETYDEEKRKWDVCLIHSNNFPKERDEVINKFIRAKLSPKPTHNPVVWMSYVGEQRINVFGENCILNLNLLRDAPHKYLIIGCPKWKNFAIARVSRNCTEGFKSHLLGDTNLPERERKCEAIWVSSPKGLDDYRERCNFIRQYTAL